MRILALLFLLVTGGQPAQAEQVVMGLSQDEVAITATFEGDEILIFGAIQRETPINTDIPLGVVITVEGPSSPIVVRRKERRFGIWVNVDAVEVDSAPSFYAVTSSGPLDEVLTNTENLRHNITIDRAIQSRGAPMHITDSAAFSEALVRIREEAGLYKLIEGGVDLEEQTLFHTTVSLPANLTEGHYAARIFLTREGEVLDIYETPIEVVRVGIGQWLFALSRNQPLLYGLMSLAIAIAAGWTASTVFSALKR